MRITLTLLLLGSLATRQPAAAQAPQPAHTLQLPEKEFILGAVRLANGSPVVWTRAGGTYQCQLRAFTAAGQPAWEATVPRASLTYAYEAQLMAWGNRLVLLEPVERANPTLKLQPGQLLLQVIDEQGRVTPHALDAPPLAANTERSVVGSYLENDACYVLAEHRAKKAGPDEWFVERYDLTSKTLQRSKLALPARYDQQPDKSRFTDWVYGGHRPDRTYFYRYAGTPGQPNDYPKNAGPEFDVCILDNAGRLVSSFTTTLHQQLQPGTFSYYSGRMPHAPAQGHTPVELTQSSMGSGGRTNFDFPDLYNLTMGGTGDLYLDPATGECWFWGEYASAPFTTLRAFLKPTEGTYLQRYSAEGKLLSTAQAPYPAGTSTGLRTPSPERQARLLRAPDTGELTMQFAPRGSWQLLFATYNAAGQLQTTGAWPGTSKQELGLPLALLSEQQSTLEGSGYSQLSAAGFLAADKATTGLLPRVKPVVEKATAGRAEIDVLYLVPQDGSRGLLLQTHFERKGSVLTLYQLP
ncbi:hypothetical protein EJV47_07805 [Hymenobacter gummosus]|uniref:DUF4595 domain-containing protein n=1 Tax=Hymenobacter gummosus TaxID=1776032 RepID=A0A431U5U1_9BACT|nr:hypothetical protein [Hymenobacter gummosus]RTQ51691.1 hypothetical protein EJV47_07805 [Hymenobacter gummosus]